MTLRVVSGIMPEWIATTSNNAMSRDNLWRWTGLVFIAVLAGIVAVVLVARPFQWMNDDAYFI